MKVRKALTVVYDQDLVDSVFKIPKGIQEDDSNAFECSTGLRKVILPNSISDYLDFDNCTALKTIEIEEGNEKYFSIDGVLFNKNKVNRKRIKTNEVIKQSYDRLDALKNPDRFLKPVLTGFDDLDKLITGFHKDDLIVLGSRPGMGKTSFALNIACHVALVENKRIAFFRSKKDMNNFLSGCYQRKHLLPRASSEQGS